MNESASKNWSGGRYVKFCLEASMEDETFNTFKQSPNYTKILEHVTEEQGTAYLSHCKDFILNNNLQEKIKHNDSLGTPKLYEYPDVGIISPTTLRYSKVLKDIAAFTDLNGKDVVEIGGGYGGQYTVLRQLFTPKSYTFVDLPETNQLISKYINKANLDDIPIHYINGEIESEEVKSKYDFCISNYAISECPPRIIDLYVERYVLPSDAGYITWNHLTGYPLSNLTSALVEKINDPSKLLISAPGISGGGRNKILTWDNG